MYNGIFLSILSFLNRKLFLNHKENPVSQYLDYNPGYKTTHLVSKFETNSVATADILL